MILRQNDAQWHRGADYATAGLSHQRHRVEQEGSDLLEPAADDCRRASDQASAVVPSAVRDSIWSRFSSVTEFGEQGKESVRLVIELFEALKRVPPGRRSDVSSHAEPLGNSVAIHFDTFSGEFATLQTLFEARKPRQWGINAPTSGRKVPFRW